MIYTKLYDWQKNIIDSLESKESFGLFLDCGLGKTPQALALAERHKACRIIIVTINSKAEESISVSGSWLKWSTDLELAPYTPYGKKSKVISNDEHSLYLTNYEALYDRKATKGVELKPILKEYVKTCKDKDVCLIIDESHKMKNLQSTQTKALIKLKKELKLVSKSLHSYLLTGTPFTTGFIDLYAQLSFLGCPMKKDEFVNTFCIRGRIPGLVEWQQPIIGYKNIDQLYKLIHNYAITIKSNDVLKLPDQIKEYHTTPSSPWFRLLTKEKLKGNEIVKYNEIRKKLGLPYIENDLPNDSKSYPNPWFRNLDYPELNYLCDTPASLWMRARQISVGFQGNAEKYLWFDRARLDKLKEFLDTNPDNYVIFYNYTPEFIELYQVLDELGYHIDVYSGLAKQLTFYDKFESQTESERLTNTKNVILANYASGSTGKNWQLYTKAILFSLPLYKDYEQGLKRIHRIGSNQTVIYHIFTQDNWLDDGLIESLNTSTDYNLNMFNKDLNLNQ